MPDTPTTLGLIAGEGEFPKMVARGARRAGRRVVIVGLKNNYDPEIPTLADAFYPAGVARLGRWIRCFRREGVSEAVMAGRVRKATPMGMSRLKLWLAYLPDWTSIRLWFSARDRRNDTLFLAVAEEMRKNGVTFIDSTKYCPEAMAAPGPMTSVALSPRLQADLDFGLPLCRELGRLDIGQAIVVREKDVIAVEAIEGTDLMIERAAQLCPGGGWMLIKLAKPNQDMRFDVPAIGPNTIEKLVRHKAGALVVEAGKTLVIEREKTIQLANRAKLPVVGVDISTNIQEKS
ncbi:MAG: LpxI family protein [Phycisphaerales bacterium]|nr:LpxI family protein [Phycisphaerales bacterium]MCB9856917.1 LpxI family protein [Phycisphaerales bacterium]MCB9861956.1 LpxI family protein [Phycisphaerales bacterium]